MTFSLLGLIAFQWYWVSNYFESNRLELDWEINRVLARTADRYLNDSMEGILWFSGCLIQLDLHLQTLKFL